MHSSTLCHRPLVTLQYMAQIVSNFCALHEHNLLNLLWHCSYKECNLVCHHEPHISLRLPLNFPLLQLSTVCRGRQKEQLCWKGVMEEDKYGLLCSSVISALEISDSYIQCLLKLQN